MTLRPCSYLLAAAASNSTAVMAIAKKPRGIGISIEGNIGVGKSTILQLLQKHPLLSGRTEVFPEPLAKWQSVGPAGHNLLEAFYKDTERNSYLFQNYVFLTRFVQHHTSAIESASAIRLLERCVFTDRCVFAATAIETGLFTPLEAAAYNEWYDPVVAALPNLIPDAFVYLRADPKICHQRLKDRARSEEVGVGLEYLQALHDKHEQWLFEGMVPTTGSGVGSKASAQAKMVRGGAIQGHLSGQKTHSYLDGRPCLVVDWNDHLQLDGLEGDLDMSTNAIAEFVDEVLNSIPNDTRPLPELLAAVS